MDDNGNCVIDIENMEELQAIIEKLPDGVMLEIVYEEGESSR